MMKPSNQRGPSDRAMAAMKGIVLTCLTTFVVFMIWFLIREEVLGNRDDIIALLVQTIVCAGLLFVGCGASIAYAIIGNRDQASRASFERDKKPPAAQGDGPAEQC